jgi:diacylglycerol O-acyltransferase / wax synthase
VPIPDGHGLTIGALSYAGRVGIGLYADAGSVPDAVEIARDLESALDALRVAPSGALSSS